LQGGQLDAATGKFSPRLVPNICRCQSTVTEGMFVSRYVCDHCHGIRGVVERGRVGSAIRNRKSETTNLDVVEAICAALDEFESGISETIEC
jgi:dTDP-D-glucose 4,6-dehydratase